jgi:hypothetical protein
MKQQGMKDVIQKEGRTSEEVQKKVWKDRDRQKCLVLR